MPLRKSSTRWKWILSGVSKCFVRKCSNWVLDSRQWSAMAGWVHNFWLLQLLQMNEPVDGSLQNCTDSTVIKGKISLSFFPHLFDCDIEAPCKLLPPRLVFVFEGAIGIFVVRSAWLSIRGHGWLTLHTLVCVCVCYVTVWICWPYTCGRSWWLMLELLWCWQPETKRAAS